MKDSLSYFLGCKTGLCLLDDELDSALHSPVQCTRCTFDGSLDVLGLVALLARSCSRGIPSFVPPSRRTIVGSLSGGKEDPSSQKASLYSTGPQTKKRDSCCLSVSP